MTTIYPPPSAHDLKDVFFLEKQKKLLLLLDSGVICIFNIQGETGLLEKMIRNGEITDSESRPVLFPIICMKLVKCKPPQYDCELVFRKHGLQDMQDSDFIAMSAGKGTLLFMSVDKIDKIFSRFSMHRESIIIIEEIPGYVITMCSANIIMVSAFKENILVKVKKIELKSQISFLKGLEPDKIFLSFATGQTEILHFQDGVLMRLINKDFESDALIISVDIVQENKLIATVSSNNMVQILTFEKQLLHEIKFPHQISSVVIINETIYTSYKQMTTAIKIKDMFPLGYTESEEINEDYFKHAFYEKNSESDHSPLPIEREKTPPRLFLSTRNVETRTRKLTADAVTRKKKQTVKKNKKKRIVNNVSRHSQPALDVEQAAYIKVISKKIPVITNARPRSNNNLLTRRQLTEEKIIENVRRYGDPADRIDYSGLCVVDESLYYEELAKLRGSNSII